MGTKFVKIMRVRPLFFFLQKKCMEKCGVKPTMAGELADEKNDPYHRHYHHHPSLPPDAVSSACLKTMLYLYSLAPNYPMKKGDAHLKRSEMLVVSLWGL